MKEGLFTDKIRAKLLIDDFETGKTDTAVFKSCPLTEKFGVCTATTVYVKTQAESEYIGRDIGTYITVETEGVREMSDADFEATVDVIAQKLRSLMPRTEGRVLVAGIGSREITPDSLGPKCVDGIIVTRGFEKVMPQLIENGTYSSVCAVCPNVFGVTGIESAELIGGIVHITEPSLVIVVDALSTSSAKRLCKTVQLSDTALIPGGGVNNSREKISPITLNVPVITVGMPTVMDVRGILETVGCNVGETESFLGAYYDSMLAIPSDIDSATDVGARLIAFAVNKALHRDMSVADMLRFLY